MSIRESGLGEVWEVRNGGGILLLLGLPFAAAGLFVMGIGLGLVPVNGDAPPALFAIPFGLVFASVGLGLMFGRSGMVIDKRRGTLTTWWGMVVPWRRQVRPLEEFTAVTISREVRRSKNSSYTVFPVRIEPENGAPAKLEEPRVYEPARACAERVAKFLVLPVIDRSSGEETVRSADRLDTPLRDLVREQGGVELPDPPSVMCSHIRQKDRTIMIEIPLLNAAFARTLILIIVAISELMLAVFFVGMARVFVDAIGVAIVIGFAGASVMVLPAFLVLRRKLGGGGKPTRIFVSPTDGVRVEGGGRGGGNISVGELEEIVVSCPTMTVNGRIKSVNEVPEFARQLMAVAGQGGLVLRSDTKTIHVGAGLGREELEYLRSVICHALAS